MLWSGVRDVSLEASAVGGIFEDKFNVALSIDLDYPSESIEAKQDLTTHPSPTRWCKNSWNRTRTPTRRTVADSENIPFLCDSQAFRQDHVLRTRHEEIQPFPRGWK
jgi:hypothetical protein